MNPNLPRVEDYKETPAGTHFRLGTPEEVIEVLERARVNRYRIAVVYQGDSVPEYGRVGRTTGPALKVPMLIHNTRSTGGSPICTTIIREIRTTEGGRILYQAQS